MAKRPQKAGQTAEQSRRAQYLALLRGGPEGLAAWHALSLEQRLEGGPYRKADLSGAALHRAMLCGEWQRRRRIDFTQADFTGADLSGASLDAAIFRGAIFHNANLTDAHGAVAGFASADFTGANLTGTRLVYCSFRNACFPGANLTGVRISQSDLRGADLSTATLDRVQFTQTKYDAGTRWPAGFATAPGLVWKGRGLEPITGIVPGAPGSMDLAALLGRLKGYIDPVRLDNALKMLKASRFQLYVQLDASGVVGVVGSQTGSLRVYSCRLGSDGVYGCCTQNLKVCGGLRGAPCKHLFVLLIGLIQAGQADAATIDYWLQIARKRKPALDREIMTATFLRYQQAQSGEVDWRPTETVPEDFYAL
jgi:hypothetical protein